MKFVLVAIIIFLVNLSAQVRPPVLTERGQVFRSGGLLDRIISLDRDIYFSGEDVCIDIGVKNNAGQTLDIFPPFEDLRNSLRLQKHPEPHDDYGDQKWYMDEKWVPIDLGRRDDEMIVGPSGPLMRARDTISIQPGETMKEHFCWGKNSLLPPAEYRMCFGNACQEFSTVDPDTLSHHSTVAVSAYENVLREARLQVEAGCAGVDLGLLESKGRKYLISKYQARNICVDGRWTPNNTRLAIRNFTPYIRVAEITTTPSKLVADVSGTQMTLRVTDASGEVSAFNVELGVRTLDQAIQERAKIRDSRR